MELKTNIFHGSTKIVEKPQWNYKKPGWEKETRDFGEGFYSSPSMEYPIFLYSKFDDVYVNQYELDTAGLKVLRFKNDLLWLLTTGFHRRDFSDYPECHQMRDWCREWLAGFDLVIGTISNDNFHSALEDFLDDGITDFMVLQFAQSIKHGEQYVSKSSKTDMQIKYLDHIKLNLHSLLEQREVQLVHRRNMRSFISEMKVRLRPQDNGRLFSEILAEVVAHGRTWFEYRAQ